MTRVCILTTVHCPFDHRIFYKQAISLQKYGYQVSIVGPHKKAETVNGIRIIPIKKPKNRILRIFLALKMFWISIKENAEIFHFHDPELIPVGLLLNVFGKKVIYDVHEEYPEKILEKDWIKYKLMRRFLSNVIYYLELLSSRYLNIITVNEKLKNKFLKFSKKQVEVIKNYPRAGEFEGKSSSIEWERRKNIIYLGTISPERCLDKVIEIMDFLPEEITFKIAGKSHCPKYFQKLKQLKGWKRVNYLGWLDRKKLYQASFDCFLGMALVSKKGRNLEAEATKLFEYMLMGLPVLASDFPIRKKIIKENKCGMLVDPENKTDIIKAIKDLFQNNLVAREMGERGKRAVGNKYSWEKEEEKLILIYGNIQNRKRKKCFDERTSKTIKK